MWEMGSSWAITNSFDEALDVSLLDTNPQEAIDAIQALMSLADDVGAPALWLWLADVDWLVEAAVRTGFQTTRNGVWIYPL